MKKNKKTIAFSDARSARARRKAENAAKKQKKLLIPVNKRPIICPPDRAGRGIKTLIFGYICRAAVTFAAVFGLVFFVVDALRLDTQGLSVPAGFIALVCLCAVAVFSFMVTSGYGLAGGSLICVGAGVVAIILHGNAVQLTVNTALTIKNVALTRLYNLGYYTMSKYMSEVSYTAEHTQEYYLKYAVAFFAILLSAAFVLSVVRRVRVALPVIISTALLGVVFTYNISRSNWGIVLIIASFTGLIVMAVYDRMFASKPDDAKFDTETVLFEDDDRPKLPEGAMTKSAARMLRREKKLEYAQIKKKHKKEKTQVNVDEELSAYFGSSDKVKKQKADKKAPKLTPEQKKAQRELDRQVNDVVKYDKRVRESRTAQGGFAAMGAFVVAMIMLLFPALTVSGSFTTIRVIDERMEYYREYVTAWLMGDDPILDELGYQNDQNNFEPHSTAAQKQVFTGVRLFTVETQYNANVYLRGWIGVDYDGGAWLPANDEQLAAYRTLYGTYLDPTETMFANFYGIMNPSAIEDKDFSTKYTSNTKYGFIAMQVNASRVETGDSLVYMPAFYRVNDTTRDARATGHGLYEYGTSSLLEDVTFVNYFDGIYTGRKFMSELAYASVSYVTTMKNIDWYSNVAKCIAEYNEGYVMARDAIEKYATRRASGKSVSLDTITEQLFAEAPDNLLSVEYSDDGKTKIIYVKYNRGTGVYTYDVETRSLVRKIAIDLPVESYTDPATGELVSYTIAFVPPELSLDIRYRELMTDEEKRTLAYTYYYQYMYTDYVYDTYLDKAGSAIISDALQAIINTADGQGNTTDYSLAAEQYSADANAYEQRHKLVMAIIDYMSANCTYTLEPSAVADASLDGIENFLTYTKEGYCVQYASALALMLREAGIPARYVEGYVACDFSRNYSSESVGRYVTSVRDYNAHAWVEVWFDGVGWIQYEATPVYHDDMYYTESFGEGSGVIIRPWYDPDNATTEEEELLDSLASLISLSEARIGAMRDDIKLLIGNSRISTALDNISLKLGTYADNLEIQKEYYASNRDGDSYDPVDFKAALNSFIEAVGTNVTEQLDYQQVRIESLAALNRLIWIIVAIVAVIAAAVVMLCLIGLWAKKAEQKRMKAVNDIIAGGLPDSDKSAAAKQLIDWFSALLAEYGSAPHAGEFRDEYAERLCGGYAGMFDLAKDKDVTPEEKMLSTGNIDFHSVLYAVAAEEFGYGMTSDELAMLAKAYVKLRYIAPKQLNIFKRFRAHYIKHII